MHVHALTLSLRPASAPSDRSCATVPARKSNTPVPSPTSTTFPLSRSYPCSRNAASTSAVLARSSAVRRLNVCRSGKVQRRSCEEQGCQCVSSGAARRAWRMHISYHTRSAADTRQDADSQFRFFVTIPTRIHVHAEHLYTHIYTHTYTYIHMHTYIYIHTARNMQVFHVSHTM